MKKRDEQVIVRRFIAGELIWEICQFDGRNAYRGAVHQLDPWEVEDILRRRLKQRQWKEAP